MAYLCDPAATREVVARFGLHPQKRYGQNFLIDVSVPRQLIEGAGITEADTVLEIGPGIGTLTQLLAESARQVVAVEIDSHLLPVLAETLSAYQNVTVLHQDILKTDICTLADTYSPGRPLQVAANLPYYITTPILLRLLEGHLPITRITVMIQKEVADRMAAGPGNKDYGALSLAVQYYAEVETICQVPPSAFIPQPGVDSCVISLRLRETPPVEVRDEAAFMRLIRAAFGQRRKTLANALNSASFDRGAVEGALAEMDLDPRIRGEALTLEQFAGLSDRL